VYAIVALLVVFSFVLVAAARCATLGNPEGGVHGSRSRSLLLVLLLLVLLLLVLLLLLLLLLLMQLLQLLLLSL
jgi:hypothetical protein